MKVTLKKNVSRTGKFRDAKGWFVITREQIDKWVQTFQEMLADDVVCPIVLDHKEEADKTVGKVTNLYRDGDYMVAILEFPDQEKADLTKTNDVSIRASGEYETGQKTYYDAIRHIALCPLPLVNGLGGYELSCSINDMDGDISQDLTTESTMEKLLKFISSVMGTELPEDAIKDEDKAIEWLKTVLVTKSEPSKSDENKEEIKTESDTKTETKSEEKPKLKAEDNSSDKQESKSDDKPKEPDKKADDKKAEIKASNEDESKKSDFVEKMQDLRDKVKEEKQDTVDKVQDIEKIKNESDLEDKTKNIVCSINAARERELRSYLGQQGITAERVGKWIDKFARSENLDVCCSLQNEFTTLIEGLNCRPNVSVFTPNTSENAGGTTQESGPQMQRWIERMANRKR